MTASLPTNGGDLGTWGEVLNTYLLVAHNADGTLADTPWLVYTSDTVAEGNLQFSRAGALGTDGVGNEYLPGLTVYTTSGGKFLAVQLYQGAINFCYSSAAGGPWTVDVSVSDLTGAKLLLESTNEDWKLSFGTNLVTLDSISGAETDLFLNHGGNLRAEHPGSPGTAETWQIANLLNGWTDASPGRKVSYQKVSSPPNSIMVSANLTPGTVADATIFATLPSGYAPATNKWTAAYTSNEKVGSSTYESAGVRLDSSGNLACYGVNTASTQFSFAVTWPLDI